MDKNILTAISFIFLLMIGTTVLAQSTQVDDKQNETKTVKLKITGMMCAGCASTLSKVLSETPGILDNSVEYPGDISTIEYNSEKIKTEEIVKIIEEKTMFTAEIYVKKMKKDN